MRDFQLPGRSVVHAASGLCATSHPLAAKIAVEMLEAGGSAADAAVAGAVLLGLCEPHMTGLGGDCFALVATPDGEVAALNGSGRAPAGFDVEALRTGGAEAMPLAGGVPVTVPGAVDGFCTLLDRFGRLGLARVLAPAIRYAEAGLPVAPRVAFDWAAHRKTLSGVARDRYLLGGAAPAAGDMFRAPGLAEVLRRIAVEGRAGFYEGEVAADMVDSLAAAGGRHGLSDFAAATSDWGTPLSTTFAGLDVLEHPPNGQGATALLLLNILARLDLDGLDPLGAERAHLEAEASKLAYDARNRLLADSDHCDRLDHMLSPATADRLAALIDPGRAQDGARPEAAAVHRDTIYICVVDENRMAVSLIYSIFHAFGSGLASDRFGILFHNRGAGFTLEAGHPNVAAAGKRPMHTIIPGMLRRDGKLLGPFGVMGGQYQAAGHARFVGNIATYGMDVQEAIDAPRSFPDAGALQLERGYAPEVAAALAAKGHRVVEPAGPIGGAQAILVTPQGGLAGGSDPRKDGCALGY